MFDEKIVSKKVAYTVFILGAVLVAITIAQYYIYSA